MHHLFFGNSVIVFLLLIPVTAYFDVSWFGLSAVLLGVTVGAGWISFSLPGETSLGP